MPPPTRSRPTTRYDLPALVPRGPAPERRRGGEDERLRILPPDEAERAYRAVTAAPGAQS